MNFVRSICMTLCILFSPVSEASSDIQVIINPENQQQTLTYQSLRAIFSMRWKTWENGTPIQVFVLKDNHRLHASFTKQFIGVFPHQLRKAWNRLVFSGTGQAPNEVNSLDEMLIKINSTPGAIGYITTDKVNESVKTILLE